MRRHTAPLLADGRLSVSLVEQDCGVVADYCSRRDPPQEYMTAVSRRLIEEIAQMAGGRAVLLHFWGRPDSAVAGNVRIPVISALAKDLDSSAHDTVLNLDPHPGPYWHFAVGQTLIKAIAPAFPTAKR